MSDFIEFEQLQPQHYVKISGKYMDREAVFLAVELVLEPSDGEDKYEALLQEVQAEQRTIKILGQTLRIPERLKIQNLDEQEVGMDRLKKGTMVKIKGSYDPGAGFKPDKIKIKETKEFNIEELQGKVLRVDRATKQLVVNGVPVRVNQKSILLKA